MEPRKGYLRETNREPLTGAQNANQKNRRLVPEDSSLWSTLEELLEIDRKGIEELAARSFALGLVVFSWVFKRKPKGMVLF